ncbi:4'-phosphopantetheinyl transferase family protein [Blautia sp. Sow4_E7]|uniref:4'-phosphopantetheinyl transferase family protein n=1 Tax=Blautia sp. Sow4_E7 TaxID=3438749 RepID=UPI003F91E8FE
MIYLFQELRTFSVQSFERSLQLLPPERREYAFHFKHPEDQKRSALAWLLLAYGLRKEYGMEAVPKFRKAASGKPFLLGAHMPFFSLSHSGDFVGCALHDQEIGLDIQKITEPRDSLIRRVCTQEELASLKSSQDFCRIWAMKESAVKLTGEGITGNFRDILTLHPDMRTHAVPLENGAGFLAYSVYGETELPIQIISTAELFLTSSRSLM